MYVPFGLKFDSSTYLHTVPTLDKVPCNIINTKLNLAQVGLGSQCYNVPCYNMKFDISGPELIPQKCIFWHIFLDLLNILLHNMIN